TRTPRRRSKARPLTSASLTPEEREDEGQQQAEQETGDDREVERDVAAPEFEVAGQSAEGARHLPPEGEEEPDRREQDAEDDQGASEGDGPVHASVLVQLEPGEEVAHLEARRLGGVRAVDGVRLDGAGEVLADRARRGLRGIRRAHDLPEVRDRV